MAYNNYKKPKDYVPVDHKADLATRAQERIEAIIAEMESSGNLEYQTPWFRCNQRPYNLVSGHHFTGINLVALAMTGYDDPRWVSFKGVLEMETKRADAMAALGELESALTSGGITQDEFDAKKVRHERELEKLEKMGMADRTEKIQLKDAKGKGVPIFKAVQVTYKEKAGKKGDSDAEEGAEITPPDTKGERSYMDMKYLTHMFNGSLVGNLKPLHSKTLDFNPVEEAEHLVEAMKERTNLVYEHTSIAMAFYNRIKHVVNMPNRDLFDTVEDYYSTSLHELAHSTGPALGRKMSGGPRNLAYAEEELVAELTSIFMCAELGVPYKPSVHENALGYLKFYSKAFKEDKNVIFRAASQANKSMQFQLEHLQEYKLAHGLKTRTLYLPNMGGEPAEDDENKAISNAEKAKEFVEQATTAAKPKLRV